MNAIFLYTLCVTLTGVFSQQFDGNFFSEDADYQDIPLSPKSPPQRSARPRSPAIASASQSKVTPPVAILKQINRHNEDGSYTYGFEGADGSFKIETKLATGEVIGKYGYVDDSGKVRTVEYGANKYGFQPSGEGITIPPINIGNDTETETEAPEQQFVQVPIRTPKPPKRKQQKFNPAAVPEQLPRAQSPQLFQQIPQQPYFVREEEEIRPQNQRQFAPPTPSDINSLELVLGNEFRENQNFQFRPEIPQRKTFQPFRPEEDIQEEPRRPIQRPSFSSIPIPSAFDNSQPAQGPQFILNDFSQQQFDVTNPNVANAFRQSSPSTPLRTPPRQKQKPQVLFLAPVDDSPQPNSIRRDSNPSQDTRSILDELLKQYPIPNGSPAINDFSFSQNA